MTTLSVHEESVELELFCTASGKITSGNMVAVDLKVKHKLFV
jgi:hypothetical protein